jgi:3-oxoacyl-[acyl-carrier-protein] synthase II
MRRIFGEGASSVPLLSTKPTYGHVLGASGAISVAAAGLMLHHRFLAPTLNIHLERAGETSVVHVAGRGRPHSAKAGLVVVYGMGGMNAALLLKRADRSRP